MINLFDLDPTEKVRQIKIERLTAFLQLTSRSGLVNVEPIIKQLAELSGVEQCAIKDEGE